MRKVLLLSVAGVVACGTEPTPPPPPFAGKIVFSSDRATLDGAPVLYAMNPDGSDIQRIPIPLPSALGQADISPDGGRVVINQGFAIYTVRGDGTDLRLVVPAGSGAAKPTWSPDGQRIAYNALLAGVNDLWIVDASGGQQTNLTRTPDYTEFAASWSPDGARLVYERRPMAGGTPYQLWTIGHDGTGAQQITTDSENDAMNAAFSPDGSWIAYAWGPGYSTDLRLIRPNGTESHSIFHTLDGSPVDDPSWASDGRSLVFSYGLGIATIHVDGSGFRVVADSGFNSEPDWGPAIP